MKARIGIIPLALVGVGCTSLRPWTPAVSVAFWSEDVPATEVVAVPSSAQLSASWAVTWRSPWAPYQKTTLLSAVDPMEGSATLPDIRKLAVIPEAEAAASHVAQIGLPQNTAWLLDLRGAASCAFASRLSREAHEPIAPIITFNNWPSPEGLVPADETLAGLLMFPPRLPSPDEASIKSAHPVFLLDSWRLAYRFDEPDEDTFDNRYMLMPSDLPDAAALKAQGITRIMYVVESLDDTEVEEDDLNQSFRDWQAAGISIFFVDLDFLKNVPAAPQGEMYRAEWDAHLQPERYWVRERYTLVDNPNFYARARGGFGLAWGRPSIYPGYGTWYHSSGGGYGGSYGFGHGGGRSGGSGG